MQTALLPLLAAALTALALRLAGGPSRGPLIVGAAIAVGFLVAYAVISGIPPLPPRSSTQKLAYLALAALILGFALGLLRASRTTVTITLIVAAAACVAWLAQPKLKSPDLANLIPIVLLWIGGSVALLRLNASRSDYPDGSMMLVLSAMGMAVVALYGRSVSMTQLGGALSAAAGGFVLCAWFMPSFRLGVAGACGGGLVLVSMATILALYTRSNPIALSFLILVFFLDSVVDRLPVSSGTLGRVLRPVWMGVLGLIPVGAAFGVAYLMSGSSSGGY